jgi:hypothetical protein
MFAILAIFAVQTGFPLQLPGSISSYLLDTSFRKFSARTFHALLLTALGNDKLYPYLLFVYWGTITSYFLITLWMIISLFVISPGIISPESPRTGRTILKLLAVKHLAEHTTFMMIRRIKLRLILNSVDLTKQVSPIRSRWYRVETYRWFEARSLPATDRAIIFAVGRFHKAILSYLREKKDIDVFIYPIERLLEFFFVSGALSEGFEPVTQTGLIFGGSSQKTILMDFARRARPLIIEAQRLDLMEKPPLPIVAWLRRILFSQHIKLAGGFSVVAAAVMFLGVLIFKINLSQAFLTWFSVTFGSLTISIGITAIAIKHEKMNDPK